jgi:hypothetical protein
MTEQEIAVFWRDSEHWCARTGCTEEEMLERFPSFRGTKPAPANVAAVRDFKMAAAGDS